LDSNWTVIGTKEAGRSIEGRVGNNGPWGVGKEGRRDEEEGSNGLV